MIITLLNVRHMFLCSINTMQKERLELEGGLETDKAKKLAYRLQNSNRLGGRQAEETGTLC